MNIDTFPPGTIIILNGTSSSGKTCLLKAIQDSFQEPFLDAGLDKFIWMLPKRFLEPPLWDDVLGKAGHAGQTGHQLVKTMHRAILAISALGNYVVADHVFVEPSWLQDCTELFSEQPAWLVGVRCPLEIVEERERKRKDRTLGQARLQYDLVHRHGKYDIEVNTSELSPIECAQKIREGIQTQAKPQALRRLREA